MKRGSVRAPHVLPAKEKNTPFERKSSRNKPMKAQHIKKIAILVLPLVLGLTIVSGCKKKQIEITPDIATSDEALYKLGEESIQKDKEKGLLYLRQVIDSFPKSFYAQRAKLLIADTYFRKGDEGNMILAAAEYREFIRSYPYSPSAAYCQYQIGMTFFKKVLKPGRDQTKTEQALLEFRKVITDYPRSEQAEEAQQKVRDCEERLATHNAAIGKQYYKRKAFGAALSRLLDVVSTYPDYSRMDEVYFYIADSYFKVNRIDQAVPFFTKLITDFPQSKLVTKAQKRLAEIESKKEREKTAPV